MPLQRAPSTSAAAASASLSLCFALSDLFFFHLSLFPMELLKFPFDVQRLSIRLISRRPSSELLLIPDDDGGTSVDSTNFMEDNEWSILTDLFDSSRGSLKTNLCVFPTETNPGEVHRASACCCCQHCHRTALWKSFLFFYLWRYYFFYFDYDFFLLLIFFSLTPPPTPPQCKTNNRV